MTATKNRFLRGGELARTAGVSTDTLRHYERRGVLPAPRRSRNGYREYAPDALDRVKLVRRALRLGFTLKELAEVLTVRDQGGSPCRKVRELAATKLADIERQLRELASLRDDFRAMLLDWDKRLANTASGVQARLLESPVFSDPVLSDGETSRRRSRWRGRTERRD